MFKKLPIFAESADRGWKIPELEDSEGQGQTESSAFWTT